MPDPKAVLKDIIRSLHEGATIADAKRRFAEEIGSVDTGELVSIEQSLIEEGLTPEEVTRFCNVHVELVQDSLTGGAGGGTEPPAVTRLKSENAVARGIVARTREVCRSLGDHRPLNEVLSEVEEQIGSLRPIAHHYSLKENIIFPYLEKYGFPGPSQVMWEKDNEIRGLLRSVSDALESIDTLTQWEAFRKDLLDPFISEVEGMADKEEDILFPAAMERFSTEDWARISIALEESGAAFGGNVSAEGGPASSRDPQLDAATLSQGVVEVPSGHLSLRQLVAVMNTLPIDVTFVDADDRVAYFSEGKDRAFMRTRSIIGRRVQNCHPPKSLATVEELMEAFRAGTKDSERFWIELDGRLIYIRYFAVRDGDGAYLGTLETTEDVTEISGLTGEKRLAD